MQTLETGLGEKYSAIGAVEQRSDLWLVRHHRSQRLALLQKFERPFPALVSALNGTLPFFPKVLESWVERGQIFVLLERVEARPGALTFGLSRRLRAQLQLLNQALRKHEFPASHSQSLCLNQAGQLQLRWIPSETEQAEVSRPDRSRTWSWLTSLWRKAV